jgi:hypothetical protein
MARRTVPERRAGTRGGGGDCEAKFEPVTVCEADDSACTFHVVLGGSTCATYCADHGGECLAAAWNEPGPDPCVVQEAATCEDPASDQICTCTL